MLPTASRLSGHLACPPVFSPGCASLQLCTYGPPATPLPVRTPDLPSFPPGTLPMFCSLNLAAFLSEQPVYLQLLQKNDDVNTPGRYGMTVLTFPRTPPCSLGHGGPPQHQPSLQSSAAPTRVTLPRPQGPKATPVPAGPRASLPVSPSWLWGPQSHCPVSPRFRTPGPVMVTY